MDGVDVGLATRVAEQVERAKFVLGRRLKDHRRLRGMSQVKLSSSAQVSLRCLQKVEHGQVCVDIYTLFKLGYVLGTSPDELMREL